MKEILDRNDISRVTVHGFNGSGVLGSPKSEPSYEQG